MIKTIMGNKSFMVSCLVRGLIISLGLHLILLPGISVAKSVNNTDSTVLPKIEGLIKCNIDKASYGVAKSVKMIVTAYSSTVDQTDSTPFVTASGKPVQDGIVAINGIKFGTKIRIPEIFGDKIFVVEDRLHSRKGKRMVDIWMPSREEAVLFGFETTVVQILEG